MGLIELLLMAAGEDRASPKRIVTMTKHLLATGFTAVTTRTPAHKVGVFVRTIADQVAMS
jgi:hypothetical protein